MNMLSIVEGLDINPTYILLFDLIVTFLNCFRSGIRRNNSEYMLAGRQMFCPIMYIKKHTIYQIIMNSLVLRAKKIFIRKTLGHTAVLASKASSVTL